MMIVCIFASGFAGAQEYRSNVGAPIQKYYNDWDYPIPGYEDTDTRTNANTPPPDLELNDSQFEFDDLDELQSLLPEHLQAPLPFRGRKSNNNTYDARRDSFARSLKPTASQPPSAIEKFYRDITGDKKLAQHGYDFFAGRGNANTIPSGGVQDDYILGPGDRLNISFLGERKDRDTYAISRNGAITIDLMPPIAASGKTIEGLRHDLKALLDAQNYHGEVFISLERIRQVGVLIAGHVNSPGRHAMTPLQTVLEAIEQAGGIKKTGSLRQIRLIRAGETTIIDLYSAMGTDVHQQDIPTLRNGDRIIIPPLGPTIALSGDVRQPGIYELAASAKTNTQDALQLAGGLLSRGQNRITLMVPQSDGRRTAQAISVSTKMMVGDGAVLSVTRTIDKPAASFTLSGETRSPGTYPLVQYKKLSKLLRSQQIFGDDVYPLMGVISRRRTTDLSRDLIAFSPQDIFIGRADVPLKDGDHLYLVSHKDVRAVMNQKRTQANKDDQIVLSPLIRTFIREHSISIQGAVRLPGQWPVSGPVPVSRILDVAGGALSDADLTRTEINRNNIGLMTVSAGSVSRRDVVNLSDVGIENVTVTFGDAVRIPDRFEAVTRQSVAVYGEVRNPGTYDLMRGDTLLTLIERAGGLTDQAYPLGTVFSRAAERRREKEKFAAAARDMERAIALAVKGEDGKVDTTQIALAKELADELKTIEPVGRVNVQGDPGILQREPEQNILLESGDRVYIPKRPLFVRVTGEVLSPASMQFKSDKTIKDYLSEAGGTTHHADKGRIFVLHPDGSAQPVALSSWTRIKPLMITPGSTVVVPRDPKPFDFIESAKDITQILSNVAVTAIYAEDLIDRN